MLMLVLVGVITALDRGQGLGWNRLGERPQQAGDTASGGKLSCYSCKARSGRDEAGCRQAVVGSSAANGVPLLCMRAFEHCALPLSFS